LKCLPKTADLKRWRSLLDAVTGAAAPSESGAAVHPNLLSLREGFLFMLAELSRYHPPDTEEAKQEVADFCLRHIGLALAPGWQEHVGSLAFGGAMPYVRMAGKQWCLLASYAERLRLMAFFYRLAGHRQQLGAPGLRALIRLARALQIEEPDRQQLEQQAMLGGSPFAVLEIEPTADRRLLQRAYRRAVLKHHPDKAEDPARAEEKFKAILQAYQQILAGLEGGKGEGSPFGPGAPL